VTIVGPVADDPTWQAREGTGFDKSQFVVARSGRWSPARQANRASCWLPHTYPASGMAIEARFARQDCTPCAFRARCTRAKVEPRIVGLQVREQYEALQAARERQTTEAFQHEYAVRSGIESTHDQAIRRCGLRQSRYLGLAKTHLQHVTTATAINIVRVAAWWREHLWPIRAVHHLRPSRRKRSRGALNANSPHPPRSPASLLVRLNQRVQPCTACATLCPPQELRPIATAELPLAVYSCTAA
jgi:hypothetical protein